MPERENRRIGNRDITEDINTTFGSTQQILVNNFGMKGVNARLVSKYLNLLQTWRRVEIVKETIDIVAEDFIFIKCNITRAET